MRPTETAYERLSRCAEGKREMTPTPQAVRSSGVWYAEVTLNGRRVEYGGPWDTEAQALGIARNWAKRHFSPALTPQPKSLLPSRSIPAVP